MVDNNIMNHVSSKSSSKRNRMSRTGRVSDRSRIAAFLAGIEARLGDWLEGVQVNCTNVTGNHHCENSDNSTTGEKVLKWSPMF